MPRDGQVTRNKILHAAEALVLERGFSATSIDQVVERTGITKGAFFYHFKNKPELARALIDSYVIRDARLLQDYTRRAEALSRDPLQHYLLFVGLLEEALLQLREPHPGCLIASFLYQFQEFDAATVRAAAQGFAHWNQVLSAKLKAARERHPMVIDIAPRVLVDNLLSVFEGAVILSRLYERSDLLAEQLRQHRNYVELLFALRP